MSIKKGISIFFPFRSYHNQEFNIWVGLFLLLPLVFNLFLLIALPLISSLWANVLDYFIAKLALDASIFYTKYTIFSVEFYLPSLDLTADMPDAKIWWTCIGTTIAFYILSFFISDSFTPLKYFLRVFIIILWVTGLFFLCFPVAFPYNIQVYTKSGFLQILSLLFATPWIYGLTYFLYGYKILKKIIVTSIVLIYFILLAPFQYLCNALIIHSCSLMFMPLLFLFNGLLINIFSFVAFFAYGLSVEQVFPKYKN